MARPARADKVDMKNVRAVVPCLAMILCLSSAAQAATQAGRMGRLVIVVADQTGAVLPGATVTLFSLDTTTRNATFAPVKTSARGAATFEQLVPGRYSVTGRFEGFDLGLLQDFRLIAGDNRHVLVLPLQKIAEEVMVGRDPQMVAAGRATFGTTLTQGQLAALSEDPDEMRRQLQDMAGPGATFRVDSFDGQQLPPKAQIKTIHIARDTFAAENHTAGATFIDIITQPGAGPLRAIGSFGFYDSSMDGQNPLVPRKGPARSFSFGANVSGSLAKDKSSFSVSFMRSDSYTTPNLYAQTLEGRRAENLNLRRPSDRTVVSALFDYALTKDQTLRLSYNHSRESSENNGVGAYGFPERAFATYTRRHSLRIQEVGPIGRRFFVNTRLSLALDNNGSSSTLEAPAFVVNDSYTSGGAQRSGGRNTAGFVLQSDFDYVHGIHSVRTGVQIDGTSHRSNEASNYLGTYTFANLEAYDKGQPQTYTKRVGDQNIRYWTMQAAWYLQDDVRIRKNLTLSPGVRFEAQTQVRELVNPAPRFGITWSPFKTGKTTVRASCGIFYDWVSADVYEQTLRVDGFRLRQINIVNSPETPLAYPDPGPVVGQPTDQILLGSDLRMARTTRVSAGVQQQFTRFLRVAATYAQTRSNGLLTGNNLNAPLDGVRRDPSFANVVETTSVAESRSRLLSTNAFLSLSPVSATAAKTGPWLMWKRGLSIYAAYYLASARSNTEGAFGVPASGTPATEWGPADSDIRHRVAMSLYSSAIKNLAASISILTSTGAPYTMRLSNDPNADGLFNDRLAGVGRNTLRSPSQWNINGSFTYSVGLSRPTAPSLPGITISSSGPGGVGAGSAEGAQAPRHRLMINVTVNNLTNRANYKGYSGIIGGPFFMKPTAVDGVRRVELSVGFVF